MRRTIRECSLVVLAFAVTACGGLSGSGSTGSGGGNGKAEIDVSGEWAYLCCEGRYSGVISFKQNGSELGGVLTGRGEKPNDVTGQVNGRRVRFNREGFNQKYDLVMLDDGDLFGTLWGPKDNTVPTSIRFRRKGKAMREPIAIESLQRGTVHSVYGEGTAKRVVVKGDRIEIRESILFATGKSDILPASEALLNDIAAIFKSHPEIKGVRIEGHTDSRGNDAANMKLSDARVVSVAKWLGSHGVIAKLESRGYGETRPLCKEASEECYAKNRRVEFYITDREEVRKTVAVASGERKLNAACKEARVGEAHFVMCNLQTTWRGARDSCHDIGDGYDLASIHSAEEQTALRGLAQSIGSQGVWYFTGLNDLAAEGSYVWSDGTPVSYTDWYKGEPNNDSGVEHCGQLYHGTWTNQWNDIPCNWTTGTYPVGSFTSGFVCRGGARPAAAKAPAAATASSGAAAGPMSLPPEAKLVTPPTGRVRFVNKVSNQCLGVRGWSKHKPGTGVEVYTCEPPGVGTGPRDSFWTITPSANGFYYVKNEVTQLCLGVRMRDNAGPGTEVEVYHCNPGGGDMGLDNQWRFEDKGDGHVQLRNRNSGLCMDVDGFDKHEKGTRVDVYHCTTPDGRDQLQDTHWKVETH